MWACGGAAKRPKLVAFCESSLALHRIVGHLVSVPVQEQCNSWWRDQWARNELPRDYNGWGAFRERLQLPSNLVGRDYGQRKAGEYERKELETGGRGGPLAEKEGSQIFSETSQGFSINPVPTHHVDLRQPLPVGALTLESATEPGVAEILKARAAGLTTGSAQSGQQSQGAEEGCAATASGSCSALSSLVIGALQLCCPLVGGISGSRQTCHHH